jgi:hypothetical protein
MPTILRYIKESAIVAAFYLSNEKFAAFSIFALKIVPIES